MRNGETWLLDQELPTNIGLISCSVMLACCEREEDEGSENGFEEAKMCYGNVNG